MFYTLMMIALATTLCCELSGLNFEHWNIDYSSIVGFLLKIALEPHTWGFRQLSVNLQGSLEVHSFGVGNVG